MKVSIYTHSAAVGPWVLLPECIAPGSDAERSYGPLMLSRTIETDGYPEIDWAPLIARIEEHTFATVDRNVFEPTIDVMPIAPVSPEFT